MSITKRTSHLHLFNRPQPHLQVYEQHSQSWVSWVRDRAPLRVKCKVWVFQMCTFFSQIENIDGRAKSFFYKKSYLQLYIFILQTKTLRIQCSQFGTKMYMSGTPTPTLPILLGAGHDYRPRRPISEHNLFHSSGNNGYCIFKEIYTFFLEILSDRFFSNSKKHILMLWL